MSVYDEDFEVIWREPRATGKYGKRLERFVAKLREKPNNWAELPPVIIDGREEFYTQNVATSLRKMHRDHLRVKTEATDIPSKLRILGQWVEEEDPERTARAALRPVATDRGRQTATP